MTRNNLARVALTSLTLIILAAGPCGASGPAGASTDRLPLFDHEALAAVQVQRVISKDGTPIAFEQSGQGPTVILVASALADRSAARQLAGFLSTRFTVINYDRRGRGDSGDTKPYSVEREVEDISALIDKCGGSAFLFGHSSGAVLALEATARLSSKVRKTVAYEPPFIVDSSRPPVPADFVDRVTDFVSAGRRGDAVEYFMTKGIAVPPEMVAQMRKSPMWASLEKLAHTIAYDVTVMGATQAGKPLPGKRWASATGPVIVMSGEKTDPFLHSAARALAGVLPNGKHQVLPGQDHAVVFMAPKVIGAALVEIFAN